MEQTIVDANSMPPPRYYSTIYGGNNKDLPLPTGHFSKKPPNHRRLEYEHLLRKT